MKSTEWKALAREYLLPAVPDGRLAGPILLIGDVDWILHGMTADTSAFRPTSVTLWTIHSPLYVPNEGLRADYGEQLRRPRSGDVWWDIEPSRKSLLAPQIVEALKRQGLPFIEHVRTPSELAAYSEKRYPNSINPPIIEVEAYSWILVGNREKFTAAFERIKRSVAAMPPSLTWGQAILERAQTVRRAVDAGPDAVQDLLRGWRDDSVRKLKLDRSR